jgi:6-phosphogluconolactonase (cycloisomerase 2 family)
MGKTETTSPAWALAAALRGITTATKINSVDSERPGMYKASTRKVKKVIPVKSVATVVLIGAIIGPLIYGCGGGGSTGSPSQSNPILNTTPTNSVPTTNLVPTIRFLDPSCAPVGAQGFTLFLDGSNFVPSSVVRWNGNDRPTTLVPAGPATGSELTAQIAASDIAATGTAAVTVFNPSPGGGSSNSLTLTIVAGGINPQSIAVDPTGKFAYVASEGCPDAFEGDVSIYAINATTGALTSIGSPVATGDFGAHSVTVDPSGKFAYVANDGAGDTSGSVSMYSINTTTGVLTSIGTIDAPCAPPPSPGSCSPVSVAVDPTDRFVYVANEGGFAPTSISTYTINATTGALKFTGLIASGGRAVSITIDPTGKFAYVADADFSNGFSGENNNVYTYTINGTTGALAPIGNISAGVSRPNSIAIDPSGRFAYVTNSGSNDVSMYTVDATAGALTSMGPIAAGASPSSVAVDPTGKFAYVTSRSTGVLMYTINATTGVLTPIGIISAGLSPSSIAIDPSGKFAYVTNADSNDVSMYRIDGTTGILALIGTVGT